MTQVIGIDPGASGAIAMIDTETQVLSIMDMPIVPVGKSKTRKEVDGRSIAAFVMGYDPDDIPVAYIEDVWSLPTDGHVGAFSFGDKYGTVKGVLSAFDIDMFRVRPQTWKVKMKTPTDKDGARKRACVLFPNHTDLFARGKDDGRAEAAIIALYGLIHKGLINSLSGPLKRE